jgi:hypothetical protein
MNFQPNYSQNFKLLSEDIYINEHNGKTYRRRLLFDFGWGQEWGYVRYPEPTFEELIAMVEYIPDCIRRNPLFMLFPAMRRLNKYCWDNAFGAISIIMEDHVDELVSFLQKKVDTDYFEDKQIRQRFQHFRFDKDAARNYGIGLGGSIKNRSYEAILRENAEWCHIAGRIVQLVYR